MTADEPASVPEWHWRAWSPGQSAEPVARAWLASRLGCEPADLALTRDPRGRPCLGPAHGADTSWSHSGDGLLLALARSARVGVDLERDQPRPRALALAHRFFAASEAAWIEAQPGAAARAQAFVRLWCAKEAVLKAHGRGLAFGLDRLAFAQRDGALALVSADPALGDVRDWQLREFVPHPGYRAALAWRRDAPQATAAPP